MLLPVKELTLITTNPFPINFHAEHNLYQKLLVHFEQILDLFVVNTTFADETITKLMGKSIQNTFSIAMA